MSKKLEVKAFNSKEEYDEYKVSNVETPFVGAYVNESGETELSICQGEYEDPTNPLCFTGRDCSFTFKISKETYGKETFDFDYKINNGGYVKWDYSDIVVNAGETLYLRGDNKNGLFINNYNVINFDIVSDGIVDVKGNLISLIKKDCDISNLKQLPDQCFRYLFNSLKCCISLKELILPNITGVRCYMGMFSGCTIEELMPLIEVGTNDVKANTHLNSFSYMFSNIKTRDNSSVKLYAPEVKVNGDAAGYSFEGFFRESNIYGCNPITIKNGIYKCAFKNAFYNSSLEKVDGKLTAYSCAESSFYYMFYGTNLKQINKNYLHIVEMSTAKNACEGMFSGNINLENFIDLPATKVAQDTYKHMFYGCDKITGDIEIACDDNGSFTQMFYESYAPGKTITFKSKNKLKSLFIFGRPDDDAKPTVKLPISHKNAYTDSSMSVIGLDKCNIQYY